MTTSKGHANTMRLAAVAIGEIINFRCRMTQQTVEDTEITDTWQTHKATVGGWSVSGSMWFDEDDASQDTLRASILTGGASAEVANVRCEVNDTAGAAAGYFTGTIIVTSFETTNPGIPGVIQADFEGIGTGAVTYTDAT